MFSSGLGFSFHRSLARINNIILIIGMYVIMSHTTVMHWYLELLQYVNIQEV